MSTFALLHGGAHGGWCWELLVPELEARGHRAVAPDLPIDDESAGAREWAAVVVDALDGAADDDVVVVGHSLGGVAVPVVASMRPVRRMVFLGAMVPVPGRPLVDVLADEPDAITFPVGRVASDESVAPDGSVDGGGAGPIPWEIAREAFYQDCPEELARAAWRRLRAQSTTVFTEPCPIDEWPDVPSTYVLMTDDRSVSPAWSRRVAAGRLGADLVELPGGHSPFLSRPAELAAVLERLPPL